MKIILYFLGIFAQCVGKYFPTLCESENGKNEELLHFFPDRTIGRIIIRHIISHICQ